MIGDSDALEGHGHGATTTEAEGGEGMTASAPPQLVEQGGHDARAAGADGVSQGDRAAVDVHLRPVEAELAAAVPRRGVPDGAGGRPQPVLAPLPPRESDRALVPLADPFPVAGRDRARGL